jgi:hypothetical protein
MRAASSTIGPLEVFTSRADRFIRPSSDCPTLVRLLSSTWMVIGATRERGPVGAFEGNILVVIKYRDRKHIGSGLTYSAPPTVKGR